MRASYPSEVSLQNDSLWISVMVMMLQLIYAYNNCYPISLSLCTENAVFCFLKIGQE